MMKFLVALFTFFCSIPGISQINLASLKIKLAERFDSVPNDFHLSIALIKDNDVYFIGIEKL